MHSAERMSAEPTAFDRQRHGTDGMPQCSGCGHAFERWADLPKHIKENHCQGKAPSEAAQVKSIFVMAQEGEIDIQALQHDGLTEALRQELHQHCSYCRQWFPNDRYVKQHWSCVHKSQSQQYIAAAKHWRRMQFGPIKDTCSWCKGKPAARSDHRDTCPILFQLSMVWVMQHDDASLQVRDEREIDLSLPDGSQLRKWELKCQICEVKVTARGLRKHMTQKHGELWQAVRPQVDKLCSAWSMGIQENICQFCNSSYGTRNVHALSCHAITQTALARVKTLFESNASVNHGPVGGTGGSADAGSVRSSQHGREAHADTAAGGGRRQEAAQAKRQRGTGQGMDGQKQKVPSQPRDIRAILRDGGGRLGGHDEAAMQGIAVRQEDMLNILKQSTSWVIFAKTESPSIIPGLVAASQKWKEEITKPNSSLGNVSLRTTLFWCLLNQLMETFKNLTADQQQKAKDAGWSTDQGQWVYQKWSPANQALEQDTARAPLQTSILMKIVEDLKA